MANSDKDILITPNSGSSSADPKIEYVGANSSGNDTITVETLYDGTKATLSFEGSAGQLFSVVNDLSSDPIFSVNDVSGIPSIEVDSDGEIRLAEFSGNVGIGISAPTELLHVDGRIKANNLTLASLSAQNSEATAVMIDGSGIIGTRELGSNAFNSTSYLTGNQTITLSGDASGSGTTSIAVTIADDSHNHIISNVDGLQTALDAKAPVSTTVTTNGTQSISGAKTFTTTLALSSGQKLTLKDANHYVQYLSTGFSGSTIDGPVVVGHQGGELGTNISSNQYSLRWDSAGNIIARNDGYFNGTKLEGDNKEMIRYSDSWLRLNPANEFTSGIYLGSGIIRTDGQFQVGSSGSQFKIESNGNTTVNGTVNLNERVNIGDSLTRPAALNSDSAAHLKVGASDVHLYVASLNSTGGYKVAVQAARDSDFASFTLNLQSNGGALQRGGNTVWDAGNDGSSSGLDADLLDGQHGSHYLNYNNLTNTPTIPTNNNQLTNGAGYTTNLGFSRYNASTTYAFGNLQRFTSNTNLATASGTQSSLEVFSQGSGNDAFMTFHVGSDYAIYLGLDGGTNKLSVGGWSMGANSYEIYHSGNKPSLATLGYTGATNANYITNNNQLTNGASYITASDGSITNKLPLAGGTMTGTITSRDILVGADYHLQRSNHHSGHLEGSYNNIGANSYKSNPIYSIGSAYNPTDAALSNMYGIGYTHTNASFINFTGASGWGMYVAADGDARVYLDGSSGVISSTGQHYVGSNVVWNAGNDGSGSGLDADTLDGQHASAFLTAEANSFIGDGGNASTHPGTSRAIYSGQVSAGTSVLGMPTTNNANAFLNLNKHGGEYNSQLGFSSNGNIYYRNFNNTAINSTAGWRTIWDSGNDGSGSGLDADTVDGIQGANFLRSDTSDTITAGTTYTFGTSDTEGLRFTNSSYSKSLYIGGWSGSNSSGISRIRNSNDNLHLDSGSAGNLYLNHYSAGTVYARQNVVWHAGNDGSGSGLDADLLDGNQASAFLGVSAKAADSNLLDGIDSARFVYGSGTRKTTNSNPNTALNSGFYDIYQTNAPTATWYSYITMAHTNTANQHGHQIAGSFYNDGEIFNRHYDGTTASFGNWTRIWNAANDGSGSGLDADLLDGLNAKGVGSATGASQVLTSNTNNYFVHQSWIDIGGSGIYSTSTNGAHFTPNDVTSYGTWKTVGSKGGYDGIVFDSGGNVAVMFDSGGNGGMYRQSGVGWMTYFHQGNDCLGVADSSTSSSYSLYVTGGIYATGDVVAYSDRRVKENIITIDSALEKVNQLRGVYYNKIDNEDKKREIGFIAQEVNEVAPELVTYAEDVDQYGVKYGNTTALLVEAVKELTQQVKDLKQEIEEMKNVK